MVKAHHPIGALSSRLELAPGIRVELEPVADKSRMPAFPADPEAAVVEALAAPLNFPPLAQATVPGDRLAIAIDDAVPCAASIVHGAVRAAVRAGIEPEAISVVTDDAGFSEMLRAGLGNGTSRAVKFVVHDPHDRLALCPVGRVGKDFEPLVNRTIFEADVVLPIGCERLPGVAGGGSVYASLFPRLCDAETIGRLRTPSQQASAARLAAVRQQIDEAGWRLGVPLVMQVVPGRNSTVAEVVAGETSAVEKNCQRLYRNLWSFQVARRASLVIATVTGGPQEQCWNNIARALAVVERLVEEGGAVAICSDLASPIGPALGRLAGNSNWDEVEHNVRNDHSADSWPAWHLARALQRGPVYFLSQLDSDVVEDLGLAPVENIEELSRLAGRHESCIVVDDSQFAVATLAGDS